MKILAVDDKEEDRCLLVRALQAGGYEVVAAADGLEALELLRANRFDLVVSDILMPKMDGFQLCRECRSDAALRAIPFVFYTGTYAEKQDEELALSLGARRYVVKPVEPDVFIALVREVLREAQDGRQPPAAGPIGEEPVFLKQYNERLIMKLDGKVIQLREAQRTLEREIGERQRAGEATAAAARRLETVIETVGEGITVSDGTGRFSIYNARMEQITGYTKAEVDAFRDLLALLYPDGDDYVRALRGISDLVREGGCREKETTIRAKDGSRKHLLISSSLIADKDGDLFLTAYRDITARKKLEEERERLIGELQEALLRVHQLSGLLPICASCKKIRDGQGAWRRIEVYIRDHAEAEFSHGICPECAVKMREEFAAYRG